MSELAARLDEFLRKHPKRSLSVGSTEWTYRVAGSGTEELLALPGALGGSEGLAPLLQHLADDYHLLFVEYPVVSGLDDMLAGPLAFGRIQVGVAAHVPETRSHEKSAHIDGFARLDSGRARVADEHDSIRANGDVRADPWVSGAVENPASGEEDVGCEDRKNGGNSCDGHPIAVRLRAYLRISAGRTSRR
jgi:hypothetical protein